MRIATIAAAAFLGACSVNQVEVATPPVPSLSPQQIVVARQAGMGLTASVFGGYKAAVDSGAEVKPFAFSSRQLMKFAAAVPSLFPAGTALPGSEAKPAIWQNRADFEAKAAAFAAATNRLNAAAQAGDKAGFAAAWRETGGTCKACHDPYRAEAAR